MAEVSIGEPVKSTRLLHCSAAMSIPTGSGSGKPRPTGSIPKFMNMIRERSSPRPRSWRSSLPRSDSMKRSAQVPIIPISQILGIL